MASIRDRVVNAIDSLIEDGEQLIQDFTASADQPHPSPGLVAKYHDWYSRALEGIKVLAPDRLQEFVGCYEPQSRQSIDEMSYTIQDYFTDRKYTLEGMRTSAFRPITRRETLARNLLTQQYGIAYSTRSRIDSAVSQIRDLLQAELLDNEIDAARELLNANHIRAAGIIAGVALERHLAEVARSGGHIPKKAKPALADWYNKLKEVGIIDTAQWRRIEFLADLRNKCAHPDPNPATKEDIDGMIRDVDRIIKTLH